MPITVHIPSSDMLWNEKEGRFISIEAQTLVMEHSLVSVSKWESKWHKPFMTDDPKTPEQLYDYFKCMLLNEDEVDDRSFSLLTNDDVERIKAYLSDPMTATWIKEDNTKKGQQRIVTSELIYYWMFKLQIDKACELWPIQRLIMLIRVFEEEDRAAEHKTKSSMNQRYSRHNALNKARRAKRGIH